MAQGVIDLFEMVQIGQDYSRRLAFPCATREFPLQGSQDFRTIQQTGQEIVRGCKAEGLLEVEDSLADQNAGFQF
jgi:hypothetical protein